MRPRCPCSEYRVDCGGLEGRVPLDVEVVSKSGGNITFRGDSVDVYAEEESYGIARRAVSAVATRKRNEAK
jgi:hypothetical protein